MTPDTWQDYDAARTAAEQAYEAARKPIDKAKTLPAALQAVAACSVELDRLWPAYKVAMAAHPDHRRPGWKPNSGGAVAETELAA